MVQYITREGDMTAVDTASALTSLGSEGAQGNVIVPAGVNAIKQIIVAASSDGAAVGSSTFFIRLKGNGLKEGQQTICVGAMGGTLATTGIAAVPPVKLDVDIPVTANNQITIEAEMCGADSGTARCVATLAFV